MTPPALRPHLAVFNTHHLVAYFGGYAGDNFAAVAQALDLPPSALVTLARNSFEASFVDERTRNAYLARIDAVVGSRV